MIALLTNTLISAVQLNSHIYNNCYIKKCLKKNELLTNKSSNDSGLSYDLLKKCTV